jgi:hypothetical protein
MVGCVVGLGGWWEELAGVERSESEDQQRERVLHSHSKNSDVTFFWRAGSICDEKGKLLSASQGRGQGTGEKGFVLVSDRRGYVSSRLIIYKSFIQC